MKYVSFHSGVAPSSNYRSRVTPLNRTFPRRAIFGTLSICFALVALPTVTRAQGIFLTGIGPVNTSMGGAAVAAPLDSAGALFWNSATTSGLKQSEMEMGIGFVLPTTTLSSTRLRPIWLNSRRTRRHAHSDDGLRF